MCIQYLDNQSVNYFFSQITEALCEFFAIASLPEKGYQCFLDICESYGHGQLKEQRAMPKDLIAVPTFKPSYIRCLQGLDISDRIAILEKVL